ncbi:LysM peptidoglycan-binding domain-containing protein, partial [Jeotgalibaca arthritidis]
MRSARTKSGNKVMRKVKGIWVAVALFGVVALGADIAQATIVSDTAIAYVLRSDATSFEGKVDLAKEVADESKKAFEGVTISWSPNTLDQVKAEIARQKELGLAAYVIQWGDTLSIIAEIIGTDVDTLAAANGIGDKDFILVGD